MKYIPNLFLSFITFSFLFGINTAVTPGKIISYEDCKPIKERRGSPLNLDEIEGKLKNERIDSKNLKQWFDEANELRHYFENEEFVNLSNEIYNCILTAGLITPLNAVCWRNKGKIKLRRGDQETGLIYLEQAVKLNKEDPTSLIYIGTVYSNELNDPKSAISYFRKALRLDKINKKSKAKAYIGLGNARDDDRIKHYREAEGLAREIGDKSLLCQALIGKGNVRDGDNIKHYREAEELAREIGDKSLLCQVLIG